MRRLILAAAVVATSSLGVVLPHAAHAQSACVTVNAHVNVAGNDVINQSNTQCLPPQ